MRAAILNFTADRANWGCQATSIGLYRFLSHILKPHGFTQISTVLFPHSHIKDVLQRRQFGDRLREIYSNKNPSMNDLKLLEKLCEDRFREHVETVKASDLIFFQGEGTMGPLKHYENCRVFGLPYLAKKLWKKPVISINQSFVTNSDIDLNAAKNIFNSFDLNVFRETKSLNMATSDGINRATLCPDFAFEKEKDL